MDDRNAQVGWTEAQWNRVREAVLREWQRVRIAGSFLPTYTDLPPSTQVVPSEALEVDGKINDSDTIRIVELSATIDLSRQQILEDDLSDALLLLSRAATALARAEDEVIFNGQLAAQVNAQQGLYGGSGDRWYAFRFGLFPGVEFDDGEPVQGTPTTTASATSTAGATTTILDFVGPVKDSATGLVAAAVTQAPQANTVTSARTPGTSARSPISQSNIVASFTEALTQLDESGYGKPYVGLLGSLAFIAANDPIPGSLVLPADRIEPMLGQKLVRAVVLNELGTNGVGLVISLAGDAIDLVVPVNATPSFTHVNDKGRYVFRVYERFALRIKDPAAIKLLHFPPPPPPTPASRRRQPRASQQTSQRQTRPRQTRRQGAGGTS